MFMLLPVSAYRYMPERENITPHKPHFFVAGIENVPYHVLIVYGAKYCSGSLTGSRIVLTAASCLTKRKAEDNIIVKVGANTMIDFGQIIPVIEVKVHEYYQQLCDLDNDIALLLLRIYLVLADPFPVYEALNNFTCDEIMSVVQLVHLNISLHYGDRSHNMFVIVYIQEHVTFGKVKKGIIVDSDVALRVGTRVLVAGWGSSNLQANNLNMLLQSEMAVMEKTLCQNVYKGLITPSNFCVKYTRDQRLSDNGGSAVFDDVIVGLLSAKGTNLLEPHIAILTNASYFHRWINLNTEKFLKKYCAINSDIATIVLDSDE